MIFSKEADFEKALIAELTQHGWSNEIIKNPTEEDLLKNWANILYENNRGIDRLNDYPLTDGEMRQILEQIKRLKTPLKLNGFINGKSISITRDNLEDKAHFGKEISLKIYDRNEIAAGQSRYQIAEQPRFIPLNPLQNKRRGDLMLLINGMPVIHIELKRSGTPVSQACYQIEKYSDEGVFTGIFSLVQVFVAMTPDETVYFANPGKDGKFNPDYYFHWADFNNNPINDWKDIASKFLFIPMAHQLIGFYTVADDTDGILKVMRSYQYYAANAISMNVANKDWHDKNMLGGYVWHTTGSGKTMTSFKSAQLISNSMDADKVIFLMDRIELGTQSLREYRGFADDKQTVQATENTEVLINKLKSTSTADMLIVTSIQKMSNIKDDGMNTIDIKKMNSKRIVFIVDEAHRSTFGDMLITIKDTFPNALFFGFTGTPIQKANQKKLNTTATVFGNELHRYSIADGIRDKNVLGFDPYMVLTYKDKDLREKVALQKCNAATVEEAINEPAKAKIFYHFMNDVEMAGHYEGDDYIGDGIEDYIPDTQYNCDKHRQAVVQDILDGFTSLTYNGKFHTLLATSSIAEAIEYYRVFKSKNTPVKVSALFDPNIDNNAGHKFKEDGLLEILADYNQTFDKDFSMGNYASYKKDIVARLSHKEPYIGIEKNPEELLNILIVVDQMLTGFDSKWVNTLYLDKVMTFEKIIQAFSRTNRLFGPEKPFGTIRYYRYPHIMKKHIDAAVKEYSGDKPLGLFVDRLEQNLNNMNAKFTEISSVFESADVEGFVSLPEDDTEKKKFAKLFNELNRYLEAAKIQGFRWNKQEYKFENRRIVTLSFNEQTYLILVQRYKELSSSSRTGDDPDSLGFDINTYITEINTGRIDDDYMNSRFVKYLKSLSKADLSDLHKSFATLTQEEQKFAYMFLHNVESGNADLEEGKTFRDYIMEYMEKSKNDLLHRISTAFGLNEALLRTMISLKITENNINEFGRFDELKKSVNIEKAKEFIKKKEKKDLSDFQIIRYVDKILRSYIISNEVDELFSE